MRQERKIVPAGLLLLTCFFAHVSYVQAAGILTYHDIVDNRNGDPYAVTRKMFRAHMDMLRREGYQPVSLQQLLRAQDGSRPLPDKPVVITFDDGLRSYSELALPLLQEYGYPSVLSVVTGWLDGVRTPQEYKNRLLDWQQLRHLGKNPLVEIVSHSHDLHHWVQSDPYGGSGPAAVTRMYHGGQYETEAQYSRRITADMQLTRGRLKAQLQRDVVTLVWPYGEFSSLANRAAGAAGIRQFLVLGVTGRDRHPILQRHMVMSTTTTAGIASMLQSHGQRSGRRRVVEFGLDAIAGLAHKQRERHLDRFFALLKQQQVNTIIVSAFAAGAAYFPNNRYPVKADLLGWVLNRAWNRHGIRYRYVRLGDIPDKPGIKSVYTDLARLNNFNGILYEGRDPGLWVRRNSQLFSQFRPEMMLGVNYPHEVRGVNTFYVSRVPPGEAGLPVRAGGRVRIVEQTRPRMVLVDVDGSEDGHLLNRKFESLAAAGFRDTGYKVSNLVEQLPLVQSIRFRD